MLTGAKSELGNGNFLKILGGIDKIGLCCQMNIKDSGLVTPNLKGL